MSLLILGSWVMKPAIGNELYFQLVILANQALSSWAAEQEVGWTALRLPSRGPGRGANTWRGPPAPSGHCHHPPFGDWCRGKHRLWKPRKMAGSGFDKVMIKTSFLALITPPLNKCSLVSNCNWCAIKHVFISPMPFPVQLSVPLFRCGWILKSAWCSGDRSPSSLTWGPGVHGTAGALGHTQKFRTCRGLDGTSRSSQLTFPTGLRG